MSQNNHLLKNKNPYIFNKNISSKNDNSYFSPFLNLKKNKVGNIKYLPPVSKEWKNNSYFFNSNIIKNLSIYDIHVNNLIKSYFNSYFNDNFLGKNYSKNKRLLFKQIFVSKAELKHTNSKVIITIYTYNKQKRSLLKKIKILRKLFFKTIFSFIYKNKQYLEIINTYAPITSNLKNRYFRSIFFKQLIYKQSFYKMLLLFRRYKLKFSLNKYKFEEKFIFVLANIIGRIYNKRIDFNIINLKSLVFNSDIFTKLLTLKLKNNKIHIIRNMNFILNKAVLPKINRIKEKSSLIKSINWDLLENKYENLNLNSMVKKNLDEWLNESYNYYTSNNYTELYDNIFNSIHFKNMGGIRLEIKGRLTKRYRADRAVFKVRWKGGLKNIDSSYKGLSSVNMRGYTKPNVEYSIFTSKRRVGAFAVKGWISGK